MHPRRHFPTLIALLANGVLSLCIAELNHYASVCSIQLLLPACFILYPGLCLGYFQGLVVCVISGLMLDSAIPAPESFFSILLPIQHLILHRVSPKLHKEGGLDSFLLAQVLNFIPLLYLAVHFSRQFPTPFLANFLQILASQVTLLVLAPLHLASQVALSSYLGIDLNDEEARAS